VQDRPAKQAARSPSRNLEGRAFRTSPRKPAVLA
jgi:hypothetical protein